MTTEIRTILVVGAGCIGRQVAALCAVRGFSTHVHDISQAQRDSAREYIAALYRTLEEQGSIAPGAAAAALDRLVFFEDMALASADAGLVIESVPENLELKRTVFAELDKLCPSDVLFTTNSSDIPPSLMASVLSRPEAFAAFHFHAPLHGADVVDIMPHPGTARETLERLRTVAEDLGQSVIALQMEHPGYVFNNMLNALLRSALELAVNGVAPPATIDKAWAEIMHAPIGPFGILDRVGLDTARDIAQLGVEHTKDPMLQRIVDYLDGYIQGGRLGVKTGGGFYSYASGE